MTPLAMLISMLHDPATSAAVKLQIIKLIEDADRTASTSPVPKS